MAPQQLNAPAPAPRPVPEPAHRTRPRSGLVHVTFRHRERFTVVGNHLAQHRELSLLAIGLAVHIQSVPDGTRVDIKSLTARFPEGETRIAAALRELEAHGYLARTARRTPGGRMVTHTVSYANPTAAHTPAPPPPQRPRPQDPRPQHPQPQPQPQPERSPLPPQPTPPPEPSPPPQRFQPGPEPPPRANPTRTT
ncbi:hypothetical protein NMN56_037825, partial [Streptomyces iconiensis]|nr:hypothetical protein [Streptomyces iconiensis]